MRTIERSTKFKKDYKRELKGRYRDSLESELKMILVPLTSDEALDIRYRDHDLSGNWVFLKITNKRSSGILKPLSRELL